MEPGTFTFRLNVKVRNSQTDDKAVNIPVDAVIKPITATLPHLPVLIEAKSAQGRLW
jgi:P2-related tail formation protein